MSALDWLYTMAQPFVWHPGRALMVGLVLALIGFGLRERGGRRLILAAAAWAVFALLEFVAWRERADIRVDLLVTWPALCVVTAACLGTWMYQVVQRSPTTKGDL